MERACATCSKPIIGRRKDAKHCSAECKRVEKRQYDKTRYDANPAAVVERVCAWQVANRERKQAYDATYRELTRERRLELKRVDSKRRYVENLEAARAEAINKEHSRRARMTGAGVFLATARDRRRSLHYYRHSCAVCGSRFDALSKPVEWDHIIPIVRGGRHSIGNLQPLCRDCNRGKGTRFMTEWHAGRVIPRSKSVAAGHRWGVSRSN